MFDLANEIQVEARTSFQAIQPVSSSNLDAKQQSPVRLDTLPGGHRGRRSLIDNRRVRAFQPVGESKRDRSHSSVPRSLATGPKEVGNPAIASESARGLSEQYYRNRATTINV